MSPPIVTFASPIQLENKTVFPLHINILPSVEQQPCSLDIGPMKSGSLPFHFSLTDFSLEVATTGFTTSKPVQCSSIHATRTILSCAPNSEESFMLFAPNWTAIMIVGLLYSPDFVEEANFFNLIE